MGVARLFTALYWAWVASEVLLQVVTRTSRGSGEVKDRGSLLLLLPAIFGSIWLSTWYRDDYGDAHHGYAGRRVGAYVHLPEVAAETDRGRSHPVGHRWVGRHDLARPGILVGRCAHRGIAALHALVRCSSGDAIPLEDGWIAIGTTANSWIVSYLIALRQSCP